MKYLVHYKLFELDPYGWVCSVRFYKGNGPVETVELSYYDTCNAALKAGIKFFDKI